MEACYLTIYPLRVSDAGEYGCEYQDINKMSVSVGYLVVLVPPTDSSPECILYENNTSISSDMAQVGDQIRLTRFVSGGSPRPSLYVARDGVAITAEVTGSFTELYTLSQQNEESTFTCVMTHPALPQPWTCTLLTLRRQGLPTLSVSTTTDVRKTDETPTTFKPLSTWPCSWESGQPFSTLSIALIIVVILLLIIICSIISVLICRKKTRQDSPQSLMTENDEYNYKIDLYLELNTDTEKHEYEKLKKKKNLKTRAETWLISTTHIRTLPRSMKWLRRLMSMKVSSAAAKKIWNNLLVFHMLIFNAPLRVTSLTLIYPAHFEDVQCQSGVKYNYLW